jgi:hypothetical protein
MPRRRIAVGLLGALILVMGVFSTSAQAKPSPVVLVEGQHIGTVLKVRSQGPALVKPKFNPITKADGFLAGAAADCPDITVDGKKVAGVHYHGKLFGRPDPDPMHCGWGRVVLGTAVSALMVYAANAIGDEQAIADEIDKSNPDISLIEGLAHRSQKWIEKALNKLQDAGNAQTITLDQYKASAASLERALERDQKVEDLASRIKSGSETVGGSRGDIRRAMESARIAKRNALKALPESALVK